MKRQIKLLSAFAMAIVMLVVVSCKKDDNTTDEVSVEKVTLDVTSKALKLGDSFTLHDTINPKDAKNTKVSWSSSNSSVAVVSSDGVVTGLAIGNATITVTTDDGAKTATCDVTVATNVVSVESVTLSLSSASKKVGDTLTLKASINPSDATVQTISWASSDNSIATVSSNGLVTALKVGTAIVTATADGKAASCTITIQQATNVVSISGEISGTRKFVADSVYLLQGFVYVIDGAVLTINPGTVIKGEKSSMGSLIIEKGGKLMAEGTAAKPIIFTSQMDPGARSYSDWGGVILCGKAPINQGITTSNPGGTAQVEGGPRSTYGGTDSHDNSGILKYVRVEFAGYPFQPDKEINGVTFCGVGDGTSVDYVMVSYSGDDSYEFFGGTVNCKHLIAYRGQDDDFDTDFGYSGKVQFALGMRDYRKADISGSNGFESDNDASGSSNRPKTSCIFSNVTLIGPYDSTTQANVDANFQRGMHIRRNSALSCFNSVVTGYNYGLFVDGSATLANMAGDTMAIKNVFLVGIKTNFFPNAGTSAAADSSTNVIAWFRNHMTGNRTFKPTTGSNNPNKVLGLHTMFPTNSSTWTPDFTKLSSDITSGASFADTKLSSNSFFTSVSYIGAITSSDDWSAGWANWTPQSTIY